MYTRYWFIQQTLCSERLQYLTSGGFLPLGGWSSEELPCDSVLLLATDCLTSDSLLVLLLGCILPDAARVCVEGKGVVFT